MSPRKLLHNSVSNPLQQLQPIPQLVSVFSRVGAIDFGQEFPFRAGQYLQQELAFTLRQFDARDSLVLDVHGEHTPLIT